MVQYSIWKNIIYVRVGAEGFLISRAFAKQKIALTTANRSRNAIAETACMNRRRGKRQKRAAHRTLWRTLLGDWGIAW